MAIDTSAVVDAKTVAKLLRGLAIDVETNPTLAGRVMMILSESNLLGEGEPSASGEDPGASIPPSALLSFQASQIDIKTIYRVGGESHLRERLGMLDINALRRIIQIQELDPERKTGKLRSITKLVDYVVEHISTQIEEERALARTASWML
jgi:hypothetical protein